MARKGAFAAITTLGAREFDALTEIGRFGVNAYLPQARRKWWPRGAVSPVLRAEPLFARYLLVPAAQARCRELHYARYVTQPKHLLCDAGGVVWTVSEEVIAELMERQRMGEFDEIDHTLADKVRLKTTSPLARMEMLLQSTDAGLAQMLSPLFGGSPRAPRRATLRTPRRSEPGRLSGLPARDSGKGSGGRSVAGEGTWPLSGAVAARAAARSAKQGASPCGGDHVPVNTPASSLPGPLARCMRACWIGVGRRPATFRRRACRRRSPAGLLPARRRL
jgi:hypothetical protein